MIGAVLVVAHFALAAVLPGLVAGTLLVGVWVVITGGLHLDGWTDCWDSLAASVPPERRREILKDSRLGTFGAVALILLLAVKITVVGREDLSPIILFLAPIMGRGIMVTGVSGARHPGEGMAGMFLSGVDANVVGWAWLIGVCPVLIAGWTGILAAAAAYVGAVWFRRFAESRLETINGDVIGGMCELCETLFLVGVCVKW